MNEDVNENDDDESLDTEHLNEAVINKEELPMIKPTFCMKHMTKAASLCMSITFMKHIALESIVGSTSAVAKNRYLWTITNVGTLRLVNGLIVIPISITIGWISQFFEDRFMAMWLLGMSLVGMVMLVDFTDLVDHTNDIYGACFLPAALDCCSWHCVSDDKLSPGPTKLQHLGGVASALDSTWKEYAFETKHSNAY